MPSTLYTLWLYYIVWTTRVPLVRVHSKSAHPPHCIVLMWLKCVSNTTILIW